MPVRQVLPSLLQHRSASVRAATVDFISAAANLLSPADAYAHLLPLVLPAVTAAPAALTSQTAVVEQLPQQLQQARPLWAAQCIGTSAAFAACVAWKCSRPGLAR